MWHEHSVQGGAGLIHGRKPFDPALPALLMIHGSGGRKELFRQVIIGLEGRVNAAAIDLPGHGDTPGPGRDVVAEYSEWLAQWLASGPVRPVVLGHSLGGAVGLGLALARPELPAGLIMLGSGARLRVNPMFLGGLKQDYAATIKGGLAFSYAKGADPQIVAQGIENMLQTPPELVIGDFTACDRFDVMERLGEITMPCLALAGEEDNMTPAKYAKHMADNMPDCRFELIAGAGHMAQVERPEAVTEAIAKFMVGFGPAIAG